MRKVRLVPLDGEDAYDLALLEYRVNQLEKWRERIEHAPQVQLERKEAQAVISNTQIQWLLVALGIINALALVAQVFHL